MIKFILDNLFSQTFSTSSSELRFNWGPVWWSHPQIRTGNPDRQSDGQLRNIAGKQVVSAPIAGADNETSNMCIVTLDSHTTSPNLAKSPLHDRLWGRELLVDYFYFCYSVNIYVSLIFHFLPSDLQMFYLLDFDLLEF